MMKKGAILALVGIVSMSLVGCSESTDVSKEVNDAYHNKVAPPPPSGDQMKPKDGKAFIGQPSSLPTPGGAGPGGPPAGAGQGPAGR